MGRVDLPARRKPASRVSVIPSWTRRALGSARRDLDYGRNYHTYFCTLLIGPILEEVIVGEPELPLGIIAYVS